MARFIYIEGMKGSEWPEEYNTLEEALKAGDYNWSHKCEADKKALDYAYILESVNPDEEAPDHYDGNPVKIYKDYEG